MKLIILFILILSLIHAKIPNLRNEKFGRNQPYYEIVAKAANETFYQIYNTTIKFFNRYEAMLDDSKKRIKIIIDEYDPLMPESPDNITFFVENGKPNIKNILEDLKQLDNKTAIPDPNLHIFGNIYNIREEIKVLANMIAAGFDYGYVIIYKLSSQSYAQLRYKCFITDKNDSILYGAFEIIQEDKNDEETIQKEHKSWWDKIKNFLEKGKEVIEVVGGIALAVAGIFENGKKIIDIVTPSDKKTNFSTYLDNPLAILICCCLGLM